jgi:hypothetical protein
METPEQVVSAMVTGHNHNNPKLVDISVQTILQERNSSTRKTYETLIIELLMDVKANKTQPLMRFLTDRGLIAAEDAFIALVTRGEFASEEDHELIEETLVTESCTGSTFERLRAYVQMKVKNHKDAALTKEIEDTTDY